MITAEPVKTAEADLLEVERLTKHIGAIVHGVRLSGDLDPRTMAAIRDALHRHKVLFFREQRHLTAQMQEAFAGRLGDLEAHPVRGAMDGSQAVFLLDSEEGIRNNGWHTDLTYKPAIAYASVLRAVVLPSVGGDTLWASTAAAYKELPDSLKVFVDNARVHHSTDLNPAIEPPDRYGKKSTSAPQEAEHPLVHVVPETGERALLLGFFFQSIVGMSKADSVPLYRLLQAHITRPENVVRWRWAPGDVAVWDNRSTQHYAANDYDEPRVMHRVSLKGRAPVGIDGR